MGWKLEQQCRRFSKTASSTTIKPKSSRSWNFKIIQNDVQTLISADSLLLWDLVSSFSCLLLTHSSVYSFPYEDAIHPIKQCSTLEKRYNAFLFISPLLEEQSDCAGIGRWPGPYANCLVKFCTRSCVWCTCWSQICNSEVRSAISEHKRKATKGVGNTKNSCFRK